MFISLQGEFLAHAKQTGIKAALRPSARNAQQHQQFVQKRQIAGGGKIKKHSKRSLTAPLGRCPWSPSPTAKCAPSPCRAAERYGNRASINCAAAVTGGGFSVSKICRITLKKAKHNIRHTIFKAKQKGTRPFLHLKSMRHFSRSMALQAPRVISCNDKTSLFYLRARTKNRSSFDSRKRTVRTATTHTTDYPTRLLMCPVYQPIQPTYAWNSRPSEGLWSSWAEQTLSFS